MITVERKRMMYFGFTDDKTGESLTWNVSVAMELLRARMDRETMEVLILPLWNVRQLLQSNGHTNEIDCNHALTRDLENPIILIPSPWMPGAHIVIDGWHRLKKADLTDAPSVYAVVLTEEEEKKCRI